MAKNATLILKRMLMIDLLRMILNYSVRENKKINLNELCEDLLSTKFNEPNECHVQKDHK